MKQDELYVMHMLEAIEAIEEYCGTINMETFLKDRKTKDAVLRNLQVIGEAARKLSDHFRASISQVDWPGIISLRNRVVHEYFSVDFKIVWYIITEEMAPLYAAIKKNKKGL